MACGSISPPNVRKTLVAQIALITSVSDQRKNKRRRRTLDRHKEISIPNKARGTIAMMSNCCESVIYVTEIGDS